MMTATESAAGRGGDDGGALATVAPIRLLVVDDHPAVRRGLSELLEDQPDFRVIAAVGTAEDAMAVAEREVVRRGRRRLSAAAVATGCG